MTPLRATLEDRFWKYVEPIPEGLGCWEWVGARNEHGYGMLGRGRRGQLNVRAHRLSYEIAHGVTLTRGQHLLHSCDNPSCVNPAHLRIGTPKENAADSIARGRAKFPIGKPGFANPACRLTPEQVAEMRAQRVAHAGRGWGAKELAAKFGVHRSTVEKALARKW